MGTNSTRLLVADVEDGNLSEIERRSTVTRLGRGVDTSRQLSAEAIEDVCDAVGEYISIYTPLAPDRVVAMATSAVRDAENSAMFLAELRERFAIDARIIEGAEEARLTYLGACFGRRECEKTLVVDIGGGSTELVVGDGPEIGFYSSLQVGTVRHTERHITHDPAEPGELEVLAADVREQIDASLERAALAQANEGIGVAGTPTSLAAINQELDPYDAARTHGYVLSLESVQRMLSELASMTLDQRLSVKGLHPGRAPTIVAGIVILIQVMRAFGLQEIVRPPSATSSGAPRSRPRRLPPRAG